MRVWISISAASVALCSVGLANAGDTLHELAVACTQWRVIERESGPEDYYEVVHGSPISFIRGRYRPPAKTTVLGYQIPDEDRSKVRSVRWQWRAMALPRGGNECEGGKEDSAAVVYFTYKRGLRWYTLKYVWSAVGAKGNVCGRKRNPLVAQDTIILETGGPLGEWMAETIDLDAQFRAHFGGDDVPDLQGLGLMTDGDQTRSQSAADYGGFVLSP
jgi:hypothetical protein